MSEVTKPILLDETGQSIVTKLDAIKDAITNKLPAGDPVRITVVTPPTTTEYTIGEPLDLTGMVVSAIFSNNVLYDITDQCVFSPSAGEGVTSDTLSISWTWHPTGQEFATTQELTVSVATWANGTDAQIKAMLDAHYAGYIDIHDYWNVGDERVVTLSHSGIETYLSKEDVDAGYSALDVPGDTPITIVLSEAGGKTLYDTDDVECAFQWDMKETVPYYSNLDTMRRLDIPYDDTFESGQDNDGGYKNNTIREWLNDEFYNALPSGFKAVCKKFTYIHALLRNILGSSTPVTEELNDFIALRAASEVFGSLVDYSGSVEGDQVEYYKTSSNITKDLLDIYHNTSNNGWGLRTNYTQSAGATHDYSWLCCHVSDIGSLQYTQTAKSSCMFSPFGVI